MNRASLILALCGVLALLACADGDRSGATIALPDRARVAGPHMVSAANPLAAETGRDILRAGGGAVDAAIAMQMVLTLVEPQSSGIGGGAFMLRYDRARNAVTAYDGRETAPAAAAPDMFLNADGKPLAFFEAVVGGLSVGVPGVPRMLALAHREGGRLPWPVLFAPAIRLAKEGFAVSPRLHKLIARDKYLKVFPATARYFYGADGAPRPIGFRMRNPQLAETLGRIAREGPKAFYSGPVARDIVATVRGAARKPGRMTAADLAGYGARKRPLLCRPYREWRVCGMGPPSSGGIAVLQILGILENFDLGKLTPNGIEAAHLIAEAGRLAFADRALYIGDSDFVAVPVDDLLDRTYLARRAALIAPERSMGRAKAGVPPFMAAGPGVPTETPRGLSTTHFSIVDSFGDAVSMTSSIENVFGSRLMTSGFMLNNQLTDFSFRPKMDGKPMANRAQPGKRPRSSMSPTLVFTPRGDFVMAIGSPGGSRIIGYVAHTLIAVLDWGLSMRDAIALPRLVNRNGATDLEKGTPLESLAPALRALGHEVRVRPLVSGLHGVRVSPAGLEGGADPRREGVVLAD
ncbi:MAG: gamma-glutamyltransferase [Alphaproteobacteria bacterium]